MYLRVAGWLSLKFSSEIEMQLGIRPVGGGIAPSRMTDGVLCWAGV
jgi:hypothetical protein